MTHFPLFTHLRLPSPRTLSALAGAVTLSVTAAALAGPRGPEFPISVAQAKDRAEARFKELDTDGSGDISPAEMAAAPKFHRFAHGHGSKGHHRGGDAERSGDGSALWLEKREAMNAEMFERLDENDDGLLSKEEFNTAKLTEARREATQEHVFARLDKDGSGGITREELPDMSRRLEAMDADGDGMVTREEARAHRKAHRDARRAEKG